MSIEMNVCLPGEMRSSKEYLCNGSRIKLKKSAFCACIQKSSVSSKCYPICQFAENHEATKFYMCCSCPDCLLYRETIVTIVEKELTSAKLWNELRAILRNYYRSLFKNDLSSHDDFSKHNANIDIGWQESGFTFDTELRHLDISKFSREMKFVLCYALLQADDSHQLFELLSSEAEYYAKAYSRGIFGKRHNASHVESELFKINYVLQGYQLFCDISQKIDSLLFGFQQYHLHKFSLTWTILNKRMYQKWIFDAFSENVNHCLLRLKEEVSTRQYIEILTKYIAFDDEMSQVKKTWKMVWEALNKYHMTSEDVNRRERIRTIHKTFEILQKCPQSNLTQLVEPTQWQSSTERENIWHNAINAIQKRWDKNNNIRLNSTTRSEKCVSCKTWIDNHKTSCKCTTCLIAGPFFSNAKQDLVKLLCFKCALMQNAIQSTIKLPVFVNSLKSALKDIHGSDSSPKSKEPEKYHICWAVFKHLAGRRIYSSTSLSLSAFCVNCDKVECVVAKKIINKEFCPKLARMSLQFYQPLLLSQDETTANVCSVLDFFDKICGKGTFNFSEKNFAEKVFFIFCFSVLIKRLSESTHKNNDIMLDNLELRDGDIHLKLDYFPLKATLNDLIALYDLFKDIPRFTSRSGYDQNKEEINSADSVLNKERLTCINDTQTQPHSQQKTNFGKNELNHRNCIESWIKQTLNFIEEDKKEKGTNKKLEKRNRQKLKKEECKRIEELHKLKSEYQDVYFKEFYTKQELKNYKTAKKKDKKRVIEMENYIRKINSTKLKIEKSILHTLRVVKSTNPNFKLAYLPTKVELEDAICKFNKSSEKNKYQDASISSTVNDSAESNCYADDEMYDDAGRSLYQASAISDDPEGVRYQAVTADMAQSADASKSIVTIRRVNIPHLSEPQVTVTAKGKSPKDDRLLYTFINGQIVPASCLEPKMLRILSSQSTSILPKDLHQQFQEETEANDLVKTINCCEGSGCDNVAVKLVQSDTEFSNFLNNEKANEYADMIVTNNSSNIKFKRKFLPENRRQLASETKIQLVDNDETLSTVRERQVKKNQVSISKDVPYTSDSKAAYEKNSTDLLCRSMRDVNICENEDFRVENNPGCNLTDAHWSWNISIMDQINKGVQVENLMLPPGITLTKIDPEKSEKVKAKRQSIEKLSYRIQCMKNSADVLADDAGVQLLSGPDEISSKLVSSSSKKKKRKSMTKNGSSNLEIGSNHNHVGMHDSKYEPDIIKSIHMNTSQSYTNSIFSKDEPAAIIRKENGMYTIRNPAMQNSNISSPLSHFYSSLPNKSDQLDRDKTNLKLFAINKKHHGKLSN